MLTMDALRSFGANVDEGLARCVGNEGLYLRLVNTIFSETAFDKLADAIEKNDLSAAFEYAHSLKGVLGNLSLTPLFEPMSELTELLRSREEADYSRIVADILQKKEELTALAG